MIGEYPGRGAITTVVNSLVASFKASEKTARINKINNPVTNFLKALRITSLEDSIPVIFVTMEFRSDIMIRVPEGQKRNIC